ncbi:MAG: hypothetical protein UT33_C0007G0098 [Candidatus Peregrinibacteria bacterium GW2011_GWC2_39_14]|nr:MAG: hypothetical protein US92_C0002G0100 [Candidatus Peregrinibacteria bacterium GW2011_GWA2_38_36]KKR06910.1 MAG: hypothetical protein UT33_C0007G0098 [Candidatus Peregrinibacteria bacterium GW2011_GWC2_39_14]
MSPRTTNRPEPINPDVVGAFLTTIPEEMFRPENHAEAAKALLDGQIRLRTSQLFGEPNAPRVNGGMLQVTIAGAVKECLGIGINLAGNPAISIHDAAETPSIILDAVIEAERSAGYPSPDAIFLLLRNKRHEAAVAMGLIEKGPTDED